MFVHENNFDLLFTFFLGLRICTKLFFDFFVNIIAVEHKMHFAVKFSGVLGKRKIPLNQMAFSDEKKWQIRVKNTSEKDEQHRPDRNSQRLYRYDVKSYSLVIRL